MRGKLNDKFRYDSICTSWISIIVFNNKWPLKILINGILGIILLYIANIVGSYIGFVLPVNAISALIAGFLGIPGIIFLVLFQFFI